MIQCLWSNQDFVSISTLNPCLLQVEYNDRIRAISIVTKLHILLREYGKRPKYVRTKIKIDSYQVLGAPCNNIPLNKTYSGYCDKIKYKKKNSILV